ncbi:MAG: VWA domain-containing protein, partial [Anaerolineae bacterium]|nr:VWA domain-containing protein [Anaerolineae bacterium]
MTHAIKPVHGGMVVLRKQRQRAGAHLAMAFVLSLALLFGAIAPVPVHAHSSMDIQINDGALSTTSLEVTLNLSYGGTLAPTQMRFLNDLTPGDDCPNTGWSSWESYSPTKTWTLLAGDSGTRKVCSQTKIGGTTRSDDDSIEYVSGTYTPEPNPPLGQSCGLDIVLVIDSSSSIDATELAQMKAALILFVNAFLPATPTQIAIVEFNTSAAVTQGFTSDVSALTNAINSAPSVNAGGTTRYTNFDDALYEARMLFPNRSNPDMIVFSSDGNPNRRDGHPGPGHDGVVDSVSTSQAMDWAIYEANEAKSAGIHMLSIGIGSDVSTSNLAMISSASDVITSDFGSLAADLAALASQLCGGTITSHKILDFDGNLATTADQVTSGTDVAGWVYTAANVIGGTVTPTSSTTDTDGVVTLPFDVSMPGAFASLDILETVKPGFAFLGATCSDQDGPKTVTVDIDPNDGVGIDAISVEALDIVTCNFYNYPNPGTLIIKKVVVNDNGGELEPADFSFSVNGGAPVSFEGDGQNELSLPAGTYSVTEPAVSGYTTSYDNCSGLVIPFGGSAICTITNDDQPATLIVKKMLINDNGGGRHVDDFTFSVNGGAPVAFEADGQNNQTVPAGTYTITEPAVDGYSTGYENCSGVVIPPGGSATCTITNDDQVGTLIVKKVVVNDDGGALGAADFSFSVNGGAPVSFESDGQNDLTVPAGTYSITEPAVAGYAASYDNCADVVVPNGGSATCTITNDDQPATLTLVKTVVNNNGGGLDANDFPAFIDGNPVSWNTPVSLPGGATYTASETVQAGYTAGVWGGDCAADGTVSLAVGDSKTCTITNDDQAGTLIVKKVVVNDDGGALGAADFSFSVNGGTSVSFEGDGQNDLTVAAGTYTITEPAVAGYSTS